MPAWLRKLVLAPKLARVSMSGSRPPEGLGATWPPLARRRACGIDMLVLASGFLVGAARQRPALRVWCDEAAGKIVDGMAPN